MNEYHTEILTPISLACPIISRHVADDKCTIWHRTP